MVVRTVDPTDRRAKLITLTDEADPILIKIEKAIDHVHADALGGVPQSGRDELEALLETMRVNLLNSEAGS